MGKILNKHDYSLAHAYCSNNKPELEKDEICGCFYCMQIFSPHEIDEWLVEDTKIDDRGTALCPYCGIDSVIGASSGFPITKKFLWFSDVLISVL
ncbi:hypothetical protein [Streptococcus sp. DD13]|uniref:hypothetical protein n=1 Tax=Streptococcus sp. DD13 TaxID=1777881 RepID=UPI0009EF0736|nr:hypothetical protein [Streptococcus sp. DD13]